MLKVHLLLSVVAFVDVYECLLESKQAKKKLHNFIAILFFDCLGKILDEDISSQIFMFLRQSFLCIQLADFRCYYYIIQ